MNALLKHRLLPMVVVVCMIASLDSCSTFTVTSQQTPKTDDIHSKVVVALFWGISDPDIKADCEGHGLEFVATQTNFLYGLCTVATLGIVTPMTVKYRCASTPLTPGSTIGD